MRLKSPYSVLHIRFSRFVQHSASFELSLYRSIVPQTNARSGSSTTNRIIHHRHHDRSTLSLCSQGPAAPRQHGPIRAVAVRQRGASANASHASSGSFRDPPNARHARVTLATLISQYRPGPDVGYCFKSSALPSNTSFVL
jgi:hypothetical protein